jgi:hypothetical protein
MSKASLTNQLAYVLNALFWDTKDIQAYKAEHGVVSVKRDLRPGGDPTRPLPAILSYLKEHGSKKILVNRIDKRLVQA